MHAHEKENQNERKRERIESNYPKTQQQQRRPPPSSNRHQEEEEEEEVISVIAKGACVHTHMHPKGIAVAENGKQALYKDGGVWGKIGHFRWGFFLSSFFS